MTEPFYEDHRYDYDYCPNCGSYEYSFPVKVWDDDGHSEFQCPSCGEPVD